MAGTTTRLLKLALPLIKTHGFSREALSRSVLALPSGEAHPQPLSDTAVSTLFGDGDDARRLLINAWLKEGLREMTSVPGLETPFSTNGLSNGAKPNVRDVLQARLRYNEPVISHLPEAFALLATSGFPPPDPVPAIKHAVDIADKACHISGDRSLQLEWYARRGSLAAIYTAAELHQLVSPQTASSFLDSLLETSSTLKSSLDGVGLYGSFIFKSWRGIIKSSGIAGLL